MEIVVLLFLLIAAYVIGYEVGLKEGRVDLTTRLRQETLKRVFPQECQKCQIFQANLSELAKEEVIIPLSKE